MDKPAIAGGTPVRDTKLYYGHQFVDQADVKAVEEVLTSDYLTCGPKVEALEQKLCALTGAAYARKHTWQLLPDLRSVLRGISV